MGCKMSLLKSKLKRAVVNKKCACMHAHICMHTLTHTQCTYHNTHTQHTCFLYVTENVITPSNNGPVNTEDLNLVISVSADGLLPNGARPSAGIVRTWNAWMFFKSQLSVKDFKHFLDHTIFSNTNDKILENPSALSALSGRGLQRN